MTADLQTRFQVVNETMHGRERRENIGYEL